MERPPVIVTGTTYPQIASDVASLLNADLIYGIQKQHDDSEINPQLSASVRRRDVFIVQSTCPPDVNKAYMELFFMVRECKRSSAGEISVVSPYSGYARGDRFNEKRTTMPIADLLSILENAGADRYVTTDMHQEASLGAFQGPVDLLYNSQMLVPRMIEGMKQDGLENNVIAATDQGGTKMVEAYARLLRSRGINISGTAYAIQNRHPITNIKQLTGITGNVKGAHVHIIDDILASGGSAITSANAFMEQGAESVKLVIPHGLFLDTKKPGLDSVSALTMLRNSAITQVMTTDTVLMRDDVLASPDYVEVVKCSPLMASAIKCIHEGGSITDNLQRYLEAYR